MTKNTSENHDAPGDTTRRRVLQTAAWTVPVIAMTTAAPAFAASPPRVFAIESAFGLGWYPTTQGQTANGALQYDAKSPGQYLRVTGTQAGDVLSNIYYEVLISTGWPAVTFTPIPGSNTAWSTLANTGTTTVVGGVTYRVYRSNYSGTVTATGTTTNIPVDFFFRSSGPYYANQTGQTRRYVTVNSQPVELIRNPASINNTNVVNYPTP
ncbi:hypothetical protein C5B85_01815 [Pseudoclavibacter sp. AY1F1]|uniref:hypothetical protein n=1 Tax=Pseudoclavibacter sp. AY1F1 TaxID=2080583 RepID=UPI000CE73DD2|nr:hypothetical protein [Pseudoclavibacter sp. AY1F1]PPF47036.1 hypothetical protein C5B85_01815 [Pseudoclavibacter sp. AY1F1]